jgi:hypothetical protein
VLESHEDVAKQFKELFIVLILLNDSPGSYF